MTSIDVYVTSRALGECYDALLLRTSADCESLDDLRSAHDEYTRQMLYRCVRPDPCSAAHASNAALSTGAQLLDSVCDVILEFCLLAHTGMADGVGGGASLPFPSSSFSSSSAGQSESMAHLERRVWQLFAVFTARRKALITGLQALSRASGAASSSSIQELLMRLS